MMFELGGVSVTWGMVALVVCLIGIAVLVILRHPRAIGVGAVLIAGVHSVAYFTNYLDPAWLTSARETTVSLAIGGFFAVADAFDTAFATIRQGIAWLFDSLSEQGMPGAGGGSVLEFGTVFLGIAAASAFVCGALIGIRRWTDDSIGGLLAGLGVVFGVAGIVWTWLPVGVTELTALRLVFVVCAVGVGYALSVVVTGTSLTPVVGERIRPDR